jgi:hypothetical protein
MKTAFNIVSEARVAFEKACTDLGKAVKLHKGTISKKTYEELAVKHLSIIHEVLVNSEADAKAIDTALEAYDAPEPDGKKSIKWKTTKSPAKAGTTMAMVDKARKAGYVPKGKRAACTSCKSNNTLVTMVKGNSSIKACKCGYRKTLAFRTVE